MAKSKKQIAAAVPEPIKLKAFSIVRAGGAWSQVTLDVSIDHTGKAVVTNVEAAVPDIKAVAIEKFKLGGFKYWTSL